MIDAVITGRDCSQPTTVVIVDDQPLLRTGFRMILGTDPDIVVVGEASDGGSAVSQVHRLQPDVVLMDVRMPGMDGVEATRRILSGVSTSRILILTTFDIDDYAFAALAAGASGFLLKDVPAGELIAAVHTISSGDAVVSPRITRQLLDRYSTQLPVEPSGNGGNPLLDRLTQREREVLMAIASGLSNAEIALVLSLAEATVKTHVTRILAKLELRDRVQAVIFAYRHRLIAP
jgi:DNA-binding NarL/FixJ family response regulator